MDRLPDIPDGEAEFRAVLEERPRPFVYEVLSLFLEKGGDPAAIGRMASSEAPEAGSVVFPYPDRRGKLALGRLARLLASLARDGAAVASDLGRVMRLRVHPTMRVPLESFWARVSILLARRLVSSGCSVHSIDVLLERAGGRLVDHASQMLVSMFSRDRYVEAATAIDPSRANELAAYVGYEALPPYGELFGLPLGEWGMCDADWDTRVWHSYGSSAGYELPPDVPGDKRFHLVDFASPDGLNGKSYDGYRHPYDFSQAGRNGCVAATLPEAIAFFLAHADHLASNGYSLAVPGTYTMTLGPGPTQRKFPHFERLPASGKGSFRFVPERMLRIGRSNRRLLVVEKESLVTG